MCLDAGEWLGNDPAVLLSAAECGGKTEQTDRQTDRYHYVLQAEQPATWSVYTLSFVGLSTLQSHISLSLREQLAFLRVSCA